MLKGRPTKYNLELADNICERLASGESMRAISRNDKYPAMSTLFKWLREHREFSEQYAKAKEESADALVEDMLDIADNQASQPVMVDGKPLTVNGEIIKTVDSASVQHARLRVDTRKWAASKLKPKKYGDKVVSEISGPGGRPIETAAISAKDKLAAMLADRAEKLKQVDKDEK
jgi:hypothetical protein